MSYTPSNSVFEDLIGPTLLQTAQQKRVCTVAAVDFADIIGLYFAAWNKPCRAFTQKLKTAYNNGEESVRRTMEIVFVSMESDEAAFQDCFAEMPWFAVPLGGHGIQKKLARQFEVTETPCFILLDSKTGDVVSKNGVAPEKEQMSKLKNPLLEFSSLSSI
jgi:nucleoredoxin